MEAWLPTIFDWLIPSGATILLTVLGCWIISKTFADQPNNRLYRQLGYITILVFANIVIVLVLPFEDETQAQLLSLFGLVITAVVALSSTTFVANAMAGLMLKLMGSFHAGDFIRVADQFGRVIEKSLLHTVVQSEDRDLINIPNLFLITNAVHVVDQSGTLISAEVTIGYDVHRSRVRDSLLQAAADCGLTDAFVHIVEIGNFAPRYKVTGFLTDVSSIVSMRSDLNAKVIDSLHRAGIEVMTPSVMNQRPLDPGMLVIPQAEQTPTEEDTGKAEAIMFDKAELAARMQSFRDEAVKLEEEIKLLQTAEATPDNDVNKAEIEWRKHQLESMRNLIRNFENNDD